MYMCATVTYACVAVVVVFRPYVCIGGMGRVRNAGNDPGKETYATFAFNFLFVFVSPSKKKIHTRNTYPVCRPSNINYTRSTRCRSHDGVGLRARKRDTDTTRVSCSRHKRFRCPKKTFTLARVHTLRRRTVSESPIRVVTTKTRDNPWPGHQTR